MCNNLTGCEVMQWSAADLNNSLCTNC